MSDEHTKSVLEKYKDELAALDARQDEDIDLSEMPEVTDEQWARSRVGKVYRPTTMRPVMLDADVVAWFQRHEDDPETAMTTVLREHMEREHRTS